jgi:hypothetical protein
MELELELEETVVLDDAWIQVFEQNDKLYKDFYKDDVWHINIQVLYVNRDNEIDRLHEEVFLMSKPNRVSEEELLQILKRASVHNNRRYSLISILRYNVVLDPNEVNQYLTDKSAFDNSYLTVVKHIGDVVFGKTISMFHDLNSLIVVLYEKAQPISSSTKRIYFRNRMIKKTIRKKI